MPGDGARQVVIASPRVVLRRTRASDLDFVIAAENAPENVPFVSQWPRSGHEEFLAAQGRLHLIAERPGDPSPRGYLILGDLDGSDRSATLVRIVVTEPGRGIGRAALELVQALAFDLHGMHRLWLDVREDNARARSLYRTLGFVEEGTLRECSYFRGAYLSLVVMSILDREYRSRPSRASRASRTSTPVPPAPPPPQLPPQHEAS